MVRSLSKSLPETGFMHSVVRPVMTACMHSVVCMTAFVVGRFEVFAGSLSCNRIIAPFLER